MEVTAAAERDGGEPNKKRQERHRQRPDADEEPPGARKRQRTSAGVSIPLSSPGGPAGVLEERAAETPLPFGSDQEGGASQPEEHPGCPEIIVIEDDEEEAQRDLEFEMEIAALKAEIAALVALAKELQSQECEK